MQRELSAQIPLERACLEFPFELEVLGRSPAQIRDSLSFQDQVALSGLRLRVCGTDLRARHVVGPAYSAPLLKAVLVDTSQGTRIEGRIYWHATIWATIIQVWLPMLIGLMMLALALDEGSRLGIACGAAMTLFFGWLSISEIRTGDEIREGLEMLFAQELRDRLDRP